MKLTFIQKLKSLFLSSGINIPQEVIVPDISFYQDDNETTRKVDFVQMKANRAMGVILRAGQNLWPDPDFSDYMLAAKQAGLVRGTYWYYDSRAEPTTQAEKYYSQFRYDMPEMEIVVDYEESYEGVYKGWKNLKKFIDYMIGKGIPSSKIVIYTGYYYWLKNSPQWSPTELAYFKQFKLWLAWYTTNPAFVSIPAPWTNSDLLFWQFTESGNGKAYGVESNAIDLNWFNGTKQDFLQRYGSEGGETLDVVTTPFPQVKVTRGRRYGTDVQIVEFPPSAIQSVQALYYPMGRRVNDVQGDIVVNGGDFDTTSFAPVGLLNTQGVRVSGQADFEPAMGYEDKKAEISSIKTSWPNAIGLKRFLVIEGHRNPTTSDAWLNKEPRTIYGVKSDGTTIILVAKGRQTNQAGLSLYECADVMLEFGAYNAGDGDGGYSSQMRIKDDIFVGAGRNDVVADFFWFQFNEGDSMLTIRPLANNTRMRRDHSVFSTVLISDLGIADLLECDDDWVAEADGSEVKAGDRWGHVVKRNGVPVTTPGWTAITHKGLPICTVISEGGTEPPPQPSPVSADVSIMVNGAEVGRVTVNGVEYRR